MAIEAIIFDMDGLLIDSEPDWERARVKFAAQTGKPWVLQDQLNVMGMGSREWAEYMITRLDLNLSAQEVQTTIIDQMIGFYQERLPFRAHAVEAVRWAAANYPTALASGSMRQLIDLVVQSPELEGCFDVILSCDEVGPGKPNPEVYLETARRLGIAPEKCLCLEDSPKGVLAGWRAGMYVINVPDPKYPLAEEAAKHADLVCETLEGLNAETIALLNSKRG